MEHKLKIMSKYYEAILLGKKTFEVRKDDRPYSEGDTLLLQETVTSDGCGYTGREMTVDVTYILRDSDYVKDGYCIMGIKIISTNKARYYGNKPSRAAGIQPVKHGYWKEEEPRVLKCSVCGEYAPMNYLGQNCIDSRYCPWCGARMDGDTND